MRNKVNASYSKHQLENHHLRVSSSRVYVSSPLVKYVRVNGLPIIILINCLVIFQSPLVKDKDFLGYTEIIR